MRSILFTFIVITVANLAFAQSAAVQHAKPVTSAQAEHKTPLIQASEQFDALGYAYFLGVTPSQCHQLRSEISRKVEIEPRNNFSAAYSLCARAQPMPRIPEKTEIDQVTD